MRLDKWLWFARFYRTRTIASETVSRGHVRVNSVRTTKPAQQVGPGDVLTLRQGSTIRLVRILALTEKRGSAPDAQTLYEDLSANGA